MSIEIIDDKEDDKRVVKMERNIAQVTKKEVMDWMRRTGNNVDDKTRYLFLETCKMYNLNPLKREIYLTKLGNQSNIIVGYEVYLKRAERSGDWDGFEVDFERYGESDTKATCSVYRKSFSRAVKVSVLMSEYNTHQSIWKTKPTTMLRKVAIAQAFRLAFPDELGGIPYTDDEMGQVKVQSKTKTTRENKTSKQQSNRNKKVNIDETRFSELVDWVNRGHEIRDKNIKENFDKIMVKNFEQVYMSFAGKVSDYLDRYKPDNEVNPFSDDEQTTDDEWLNSLDK